ncbi:MAG TPA: hypothetical protein VGR12_05585, partial [Solirubrobacteraceae bacterium]|nr:hypothetical protein [Solirubrobacteraceae bacterium]
PASSGVAQPAGGGSSRAACACLRAALFGAVSEADLRGAGPEDGAEAVRFFAVPVLAVAVVFFAAPGFAEAVRFFAVPVFAEAVVFFAVPVFADAVRFFAAPVFERPPRLPEAPAFPLRAAGAAVVPPSSAARALPSRLLERRTGRERGRLENTSVFGSSAIG